MSEQVAAKGGIFLEAPVSGTHAKIVLNPFILLLDTIPSVSFVSSSTNPISRVHII